MKHPTLFCPINLHAIDSSKRVLSAANDYLEAFPILFGYPASRAAALTWEPSIKQSTMANPDPTISIAGLLSSSRIDDVDAAQANKMIIVCEKHFL
jgi:hypothetical protein